MKLNSTFPPLRVRSGLVASVTVLVIACGGGGGGGAPDTTPPANSVPVAVASTPTAVTPTPSAGSPSPTVAVSIPTTSVSGTTPAIGNTPALSISSTSGTAQLNSVKLYSLKPGSTEPIMRLDTGRLRVAVGDDPDILYYTTSGYYLGTDASVIAFYSGSDTGVFRSNGVSSTRISVPPATNNPAETDNSSYALAVSGSSQHMAYTIDSLRWKNSTCGIFCSSINTFYQSLFGSTPAVLAANANATSAFNQYTAESQIYQDAQPDLTAISSNGQYIFGFTSTSFTAANSKGSCTRQTPAVFNRSANAVLTIRIPEWEDAQRVATYCLSPSIESVRWLDANAFIFSAELDSVSNSGGTVSVGGSKVHAIYRYNVTTSTLVRLDRNNLNQLIVPDSSNVTSLVCAVSSDGTRVMRKVRRKDWFGGAETDGSEVMVISDLSTSKSIVLSAGTYGNDYSCGSDAEARYLYRIGKAVSGDAREGAGFYDTLTDKFYKLDGGLQFVAGNGASIKPLYDQRVIWGTKIVSSNSGKILTMYVRAGHGRPLPSNRTTGNSEAWYQLKLELRE